MISKPVSRMNRPLALAAVAAAMALVGCASKTPLNTPAPLESRTPGDLGAAGRAAGGAAGQAPQSAVAGVDLANSANGAAGAGRVVYFDYDSFVVKDEFRGVVEANAKVLASNKQRKLLVEGHTDERGGREYNLALGQKRAEAVVRAMTLVGAQETQLEAVSFGEEKPAVSGSDDSAWAKNRRAELKDR